MGEDWYEAACNMIRKDMVRWDSWYDWDRYWSYFRVYIDHEHSFDRDIADSIADVFSDWRKMVDF
jgi:hypothetical protein